MAVKLAIDKSAKYLVWKKFLDIINYQYYDVNDYKLYLEKIENGYKPSNSTMKELFFKERYFMFDDVEDITSKNLEISHSNFKNRGSSYDPYNVAKKKNISLEEAINIVNERKEKTSGNIKTFIKRHGEEEGIKKYNEFCEKSKSTLENFIKRHGEEEGIKKHTHYMSTRDSSSLNFYIKKYNGDLEKAVEHKNLYSQKASFVRSKNGYIAAHGDELGTQKYNEKCKNIGIGQTLEGCIDRLGKEDGILRYNEMCAKKSTTIDSYILKYGEEEAIIRWNTLIENVSYGSSVQYCIDNYGEEEGRKIYSERYANVYIKSTGSISKSANSFFTGLEVYLGRKLQYGKRKNEVRLQDEMYKNYYYDCYDELSNTLIEFNGSVWHANPKLNDDERLRWKHPQTKDDYFTILEKDNRKIEVALLHNYNILVVWDYEVNAIYKLNKKLDEIGVVINENCKNNKK